jgi:FlaA1/EpsC-like NDP-sugar epimerase
MRRRLASAAIPLHRRSIPQLAVDGALVALAYYLAFQLRFDKGPAGHYAVLRARTIWWVLAGSLVVLVFSRVYQRRWRYSGQRDFEAVARAVVAIVLLTVVFIEALRPVQRYTVHGTKAVASATVGLPNGVIVLFGLLCLLFLIGVRVLARMVYERRPLAALRGVREGQRGVLIVGAGDGGRLVLREIARNRGLGLAPVGFLDDDPGKRGLRIDGVRVRGDTRADLPRILDESQVDEVLIAIPSAPGSTRARVVRECRARGISVRTLPTVFELLQDHGTIARQMREVRVEDVLGREPVHMELDRVGTYLAEETVLVTGAGGSIGSELCRQIARVGPRKIVLLDHAEDNLFQIERELLEERHIQPSVLVAVLADCKEEERMREVFSEHRPTVVFHAAAYKHVGLMEANPVEAVRNNAIATRVVAHVAGQLAARRFVLVSTDKAVAPATVMGASKALAEFALDAAAARHPGTRFNAVRFGNVLGSSGSVVPIFERQIARGGPVTVTDERMTRYFMTIPEAVQLIIRSGSLICADADSAEVFVLDMGEPVRIVELARAMIDLSGLDPERDIEIEIVGRRAGEKLSEELFNDYERALPTPAEKIMLADRPPLGAEAVESMFAEIGLLVLEGDAAGLAAKVSALSAASAGSDERRLAQRATPEPLVHSQDS